MLKWLEKWYLDQCNGDWEHEYGVTIVTLDNPGWTLSIELNDTIFEQKDFKRVEIERNEDDWIHCWVEKSVFEGACGPLNLEETILIFKNWIEQS